MTAVLFWLTTVFVVTSMAASFAFVVAYHVSAPWHRSPEGRHLMAFTGTVLAFMVIALSVRLFGRWPGVDWALLPCYASLTYLLIRRVALLASAQRARNDRDGEDD